MSGWGTAAGVGAGLMTGLQFMRQRQLDDQNKSYRDQALANQQEQLELQKQKSEQERFVFEQGKRQIELKDRSDQAFRDVQARPDLADPYDKQRAFAGELSKFGTKEQIDAAIQATQGMRQKFGPQIFSELKNGNTATVTKFLNENFPGTTVQVDGTAFKVIKPDGTVHSTVDMPALISMAGMADAYTAHREALQKERKVESEISKNNALELAALGRAGGGGPRGLTPGSGARGGSRTGEDGAGYSPFGGFKNPGDAQKFILDGIAETGLAYTNPKGESSSIPREDAARRALYHAERLMEANPHLSLEGARDAAIKASVAEVGGQTGGGEYLPRLQIDPTTGQFKAQIRTVDGMDLNYPTNAVKADPAQVFDAESRFATYLTDGKDGGLAGRLARVAKDPQGARDLSRAMSDPALAEQMKQAIGIPESMDFGRALEVAYGYTGLGGAVLPDMRLQEKRAAVQARRKSHDASQLGSGSQEDSLTEAQVATARAARIDPRSISKQIGEVVGQAARGAVGAFSGVFRKSDENVFDMQLEYVRQNPGNQPARVRLFQLAGQDEKRLERMREAVAPRNVAVGRVGAAR